MSGEGRSSMPRRGVILGATTIGVAAAMDVVRRTAFASEAEREFYVAQIAKGDLEPLALKYEPLVKYLNDTLGFSDPKRIHQIAALFQKKFGSDLATYKFSGFVSDRASMANYRGPAVDPGDFAPAKFGPGEVEQFEKAIRTNLSSDGPKRPMRFEIWSGTYDGVSHLRPTTDASGATTGFLVLCA